MKKTFLKSMILIFVIILSTSCSSELACVPPKCENGGTSNSDCGCNCPPNYFGLDCSLEKMPTSITISKIRILSFPNSGGGIDDLGTKPDLFINVIKDNLNVFTATTYFNDANGDGNIYYDYIMSPPLESFSSSSFYTLQFWDYDNNSSNDLMGSILFSPFLNYTKFPASFIIQDDTKTFKAEIFVTYKW